MTPDDQPLPIEDYAMIGDCTTAALVGRNGSIDWLCWPRFDSGAIFAALLGNRRNGHWTISPAEQAGEVRTTRAYHHDSLVLETLFETAHGSVALVDFMPMDRQNSSVIRLVQGRSGHVPMQMELAFRFDYGNAVPWVTRLPEGAGIEAIAGPDLVALRTPVKLHGRDLTTVASFRVSAGQVVPFVLSHGPSHLPTPPPIDPEQALAATDSFWQDWASRCTYRGKWSEAVRRSLITLKALTHRETAGIVAAATTSLPEQLGGPRNWDYRYCWLRDATLTLFALMHGGYTSEAAAWRDWLHRSIAGSPEQIQIMYGLAGERRLDEWEVPWLAGYQGARPVRIGNAAAGQRQLDVFGEVMDSLHQARRHGLRSAPHGWSLQRGILEYLEKIWEEPDEGMWEVRSGRRHFTFSKVMAWVAFDRMIHDAQRHHLSGPIEHWREVRARIHDTVCREGFNTKRNSFVQDFGSEELDASLLLIPQVGFLPPDDPRVLGTIAAIEKELVVDGFVLRYRTETSADGLPPGEGVFLACTFWLADAYKLTGRQQQAEELFERLLALRNDVGLLSEEYDPGKKRLVGNVPQAFSHVALVGTAVNLLNGGPAQQRSRRNGGGATPSPARDM